MWWAPRARDAISQSHTGGGALAWETGTDCEWSYLLHGLVNLAIRLHEELDESAA